MLRRNLLYTGITRAKNFLILCGEPDVFTIGLNKTDDLQRLTSLRARLNPMDPEEVLIKEVLPANQPNKEQKPQKGNQSNEVKEQQEIFTVLGEAVIPSLTKETVHTVHPLIGMNGVSPYDFMEDDKN